MKLSIKILLLFLLIPKSYSQELYGRVNDSITGKSLQYSNVTFLKTNLGVSSDSLGNFTINLKNNDDKLLISSIGYNNKIIDCNNFKENKKYNLNINLTPKLEVLEQVLISKKLKYSSKIIKIKSKRGIIANSSFQFGTEICNLIKNPSSKSGKIKSVILSLNKMNKFDYSAFYNIKFYKYDEINNMPGEEIYNENIIIEPKNKTYNLKIGVDSLSIPINKNGVCVGIEIVNKKYTNPKTTNSYISPFLNFSETKDNFKPIISWVRYRNKKWELRVQKNKSSKNRNSNMIIDLEIKDKL